VTRWLVCLATLALALPSFASPAENPTVGGMVAVKQNGRTVWVNADPPARAPRRHSVLVYWSNAEQRWKPVPPPTPGMLASARNAAAEVATYVTSRPAGTSTSTDPNYTALSRGHRVSSKEIDDAIDQAAQKHNVNANLVRALIKQESNFNPSAVSNKGAMGLMQLMPGTARQLGVSDPFDPQQNVDAGVRHLKQLLDTYNGDVRLGLAAYNAGEGAVARNKGVPPYRETQDYVKRITERAGMTNAPGTVVIGPSRAPVKMFRGADGVIRMTNTE
jgi:soluble lytic murein transglycosylase-like protein